MSNASRYANRFGRVLDHIDRHLDAEMSNSAPPGAGDALSIDALSTVANFSKFHFHRQFSQFIGISVGRYVQQGRLERAARRLVAHRHERIGDIALAAGFENAESFSRAFKAAFGRTPSAFRVDPPPQLPGRHHPSPFSPQRIHMNVRIIDFTETAVAALEHRGPPHRLDASVAQFIAWRRQSGLSPVAVAQSFGIAHDNPDTTDPAQFRFDICGSVDGAVPANPHGVVNKVIPGGRCAVVRHHGPLEKIGDCAYFLYRDWLPASGEELRDFPLFFQYLNLAPDRAPTDLITDVMLPLK